MFKRSREELIHTHLSAVAYFWHRNINSSEIYQTLEESIVFQPKGSTSCQIVLIFPSAGFSPLAAAAAIRILTFFTHLLGVMSAFEGLCEAVLILWKPPLKSLNHPKLRDQTKPQMHSDFTSDLWVHIFWLFVPHFTHTQRRRVNSS